MRNIFLLPLLIITFPAFASGQANGVGKFGRYPLEQEILRLESQNNEYSPMISSIEQVKVRERPRQQRFFAAMSAILVVAVLIGFARTYLRAFLGLPEMAPLLYVHTVWY